jgi:hypothetical protein
MMPQSLKTEGDQEGQLTTSVWGQEASSLIITQPRYCCYFLNAFRAKAWSFPSSSFALIRWMSFGDLVASANLMSLCYHASQLRFPQPTSHSPPPHPFSSRSRNQHKSQADSDHRSACQMRILALKTPRKPPLRSRGHLRRELCNKPPRNRIIMRCLETDNYASVVRSEVVQFGERVPWP